jgi:putative glycosyltransferase (TIGR04372 family)
VNRFLLLIHFSRKVLGRLQRGLGFLIAILLLSFSFLFQRFFLLRFASVKSSRIGHLAHELEQYILRKQSIPNRSVVTIDFILLEPGPVSNTQLSKMWKRSIPTLGVIPAFLSDPLRRASGTFPIFRSHLISDFGDTIDRFSLRTLTNTPINFSESEHHLGLKLIHDLGIAPGKPFVCFFSRDAGYLSHVFPGKEWGKHNYRNSDFKDLIPAMLELASRGYYCIRVGQHAAPVTAFPKNEHLIDYASSALKSDFLDIFLLSQCQFFVGGASGIANVTRLFRRFCFFTNLAPFEVLFPVAKNYYQSGLPKKYWSVEKDRVMNLSEIYESEAHAFYLTSQYEQQGIVLIDNDKAEVREAIKEISQRVNANWVESENGEVLQKRFAFHVKSLGSDAHFPSSCRVPTSYLIKNQNWLLS